MEQSARVRDWRRAVFFVVTALVALFFLIFYGSIFALFGPWIPDPPEGPGYTQPASHRWHDAQWGAHTAILIAGSLLALLRRPESKPLLAQFLGVAIVVFTVIATAFGGAEDLIGLIPVALVLALYPNRAALLDFRRPGNWNTPLLAVAIVAALVALPSAWDTLQLQIDVDDEHAEFGHWAGVMLVLLNLMVAGVLASSRRPGAKVLGSLAGIAFIYLGVAALTSLEGQDGLEPAGIWSPIAAVLSILAGLLYLGTTLLADRVAAAVPWLGGGPKPAI